ncbi:MAG: antitoxin [Candidatus Promineofilum sp.]|jgi:predicted DNA binding CopG/RHH family protein|nr:antitoxin [Promineifilum sp.]
MDDKELTAQLDDEEREILESFERDEWVPVADKEAVIARLQSAAAATLRKERRVNIRMTTADLAALQSIALEEGIPYQTLMSSILHKYVTGRLVERPRITAAELALMEKGEAYKT